MLFPSMADDVWYVNRHALTVSKDCTMKSIYSDINTDKYHLLRRESIKIFACLKNRIIQEFNTETGEMRVYNLKVNLIKEKKIRINSMLGKSKGVIVKEGEDMDLYLWMKIFLHNNKQTLIISNNGLVGKYIYRYVMC